MDRPSRPAIPPFFPPSPAEDTVTLASLRRTIARLEGRPAVESTGSFLRFHCPDIDRLLPGGGLARGSVIDIVPAGYAATPAALGFALALLATALANGGLAAIVQTRDREREFGEAYGPGLQQGGVDPAALLLVSADSEADAQWAMEECVRADTLALVLGILGAPLSPTAARRFSLAAQDAGHPLLLLHPHDTAGSNTADTRWLVDAAPAARDRFGVLSHPRWTVALQRSRNGRNGQWIMEWDHGTHRFRVVAALADRPLPAPSARRRGG